MLMQVLNISFIGAGGLWKYCRWWLEIFLVYLKKQILLSCHIQLLSIECQLSSLLQQCVCVCVCVRGCLCVLFLTSILVPNREHPEYEGAERGGKISPPVIPHRKVGRRDLNTEQHPWWWWRERGGEKRGTEGEEGRKMRMDGVR